jgi:hypothetical protein
MTTTILLLFTLIIFGFVVWEAGFAIACTILGLVFVLGLGTMLAITL